MLCLSGLFVYLCHSSNHIYIMQLTHIAIWTNELERAREFYVNYFNGKSNERYVNPKKGFASYFVTFEGGASLEIMQRTDVTEEKEGLFIGLAHFAFSVGSKENVNNMIELFRKDGYTILGEPRTTGDGFYEGSVSDPDGNIVEIIADMGMRIEQTTDYPYDLLLLADPNREFVDNYLKTSDCFIAIEGDKAVGVVVVQKQTATMAEVLNLAVDESFQRKGIARRLLRFISDEWAEKNQVELLKVCTGTSAPGPLMLYQQEGFDLKELDRDYFVRNYPEPIWENGLQCRHQLILEKELKRLIDIK